jgi:phosphomannomutase
MLSDAARSGLVSVGVDVLDLGVAPTPTVLLTAEEGSCAGALVVTASHNPAEWNALKFAGSDGTFLDASRMQRLQGFLETDFRRAGWDQLGRSQEDSNAIPRHIRRILDLSVLEADRIRDRRFHVAVDCVRGAGGLILPALLDALGCVVTGIGLEPDGHFPRDPEPTAANLTELGSLVRESGAELGFAVDPDVDRLSLVDEEGVPVGEDLTLALCTAAVLRCQEGPVVTNLSTSRVVEDVARAASVSLIRSPVGEVNVSRRMAEVGAVIGGEGNGGVILPDLHLTRDAPLACALILQHLLDEDTGLRAAAARWPSYAIVKEKVEFPRDRIGDAYAAVAQEYPLARVNTEDGLRLDWDPASEWLHVRPSGTEPIVRLIAEAPTEPRARDIVRRARELLSLCHAESPD